MAEDGGSPDFGWAVILKSELRWDTHGVRQLWQTFKEYIEGRFSMLECLVVVSLSSAGATLFSRRSYWLADPTGYGIEGVMFAADTLASYYY